MNEITSKQKQVVRNAARERLMQLIEAGTFSETGILPAEKKLAEMCGVSRTPLRAVLEELEEQGIIAKQGKRGCVLTNANQGLSSPLANCIVFISDYVAPDRIEEFNSPGNVRPGVERKALSRGYNFLLIQNIKKLGSPNALHWFYRNRPLAVLTTEYLTKSVDCVEPLLALEDAGLPVVVPGGYDYLTPFWHVSPDQRTGSRALTQYLVDHGCRRIRMLDFNESPRYWMVERELGYKEVLQATGLEALDRWPCTVPPPEFNPSSFRADDFLRWMTGVLAPEVLSDNAPDALMAPSDSFCEIIGKALDILCPDENKRPLVVGFDGFWHDLETPEIKTYRPAATVDIQPRRQGEVMVDLLRARLDGESTEPEHRQSETRLIVYND